MTNGIRWLAFRAALFLSGINLVGYIIYRHTLVHPPNHGSVYGIIFYLSVVLSIAGVVLSVEPFLLAAEGRWRGALRGALTGFGAVWMTTGVLCARSLVEGVGKRPLGGAIDLLHMVSDHMLLPIGIAALAWAPTRVAAWLGAESDPRATTEPAFAVRD
ncbi:MAG: hypothetical protein NVS4B3_18460 [Gemmatimonadaceae bacterium]